MTDASKPPAAKGLAPFGMAFVLAAGSAAFGRKPTISPRALAKPRITRDRTMDGAIPVSIACGASKKADINWQMPIQPQASKGCKGLTALARRRLFTRPVVPQQVPPSARGERACGWAAG